MGGGTRLVERGKAIVAKQKEGATLKEAEKATRPSAPTPVVSVPKASAPSVLPSPAPTVTPKVEPIVSSPVEVLVSKITGQPTQTEVKIAEIKASAPTIPTSRQQQTATQTVMTWQQAFEGKPMTKEETIKYGLQENIEQQRQMQSNIRSIDPTSMYNMAGESAPLPGFIVKAKLEDYNKQLKGQETEFKGQIESYPEGTRFIPTGEGKYDVVLSQEELDKQRYAPMQKEFEEIEKAYKTPVIGPIYGAGREFLFGVKTSIESLEKPIVNLLPIPTEAKQFIVESSFGIPNLIYSRIKGNKWTEYTPSMYDLALEKKGADIWGKHPIFTSSSIIGEVGQFIAGGKIISGASKIVAGGIKTGISKVPSFIAKTSIIKGGVGKVSNIAEKVFGKTVTSTKFSTNLERWATQGYKPGKALVEVPIKSPIVKGELNIQQFPFKFKTDKSVGFWNRRIWLSPAEQLKHESRLAKQGIMEIGFPTTKQVGKYSSRITMTGERETFKTGLTGGLKGRTATTLLKEEELGFKLGNAKGTSGGFLRKAGIDVGVIKEQEYPFKTMLEKGYSRAIPLESGKIKLDVFPGFGKQTKPMSEKAIWNLRKPGILSRESLGSFARNVKGSVSELVSIEKAPLISRGARTIKGTIMKVPSDILGRSISAGVAMGGIGIMKGGVALYGRGELRSPEPEPSIKIKQTSGRKSVISMPRQGMIPATDYQNISGILSETKTVISPRQENIQIMDIGQGQEPNQDITQSSILKQDLLQTSVLKQGIMQARTPMQKSILEATPKTKIKPPFLIPILSTPARGNRAYAYPSLFGRRRYKRQFNIPDPLQMLMGNNTSKSQKTTKMPKSILNFKSKRRIKIL